MAVAANALCRFLNISAFLFLVIAYLVCSLQFDMPEIGPEDANVRIKVEGDASISPQGLQVTPYDSKAAGRATYFEPLHLWDKASGELTDFITHFTFNIDSDGNGSYADGLAFFLANFSIPFNKTVTLGGGLGLMNQSLQTQAPEPFVAVVFDTFSYWENIPNTSVSINIRSMLRPVKNATWFNDVRQGKPNNATITYDSTSKILQVVYTGFWGGMYMTGILRSEVDLREQLPEFVSIGFSGATGWFFEKNSVTSWQFNSTSLRSDSVSVSPAPSPQKEVFVPALNGTVNQVRKKNKKGLVIGLGVGVPILVAMLALAFYTRFKKTRASKGNNQIILGQTTDNEMTSAATNNFAKEQKVILGRTMDNQFEMIGSGPKKFSFSELAAATNNFAEERKLGEGGFGSVYIGFLRDLNLNVAVKRVSSESRQGIREYASEVTIISRLRHRNLVPLNGWCHENGELLLVYEYMPGGSLDSHLYKRKSALNWGIRYKIAQGLASAVSYLHEEWEQCVLHRDIKSSNVLLDSSFNARLGDFGLAWLVDHEKPPEKTIIGGTAGYVAPECYTTRKTSKESDVYSFGIVALEIACGRKAIFADEEEVEKNLVEWVWDLYGMEKLLEAADPKLCGNFEEQEVERLLTIGLWCAHPDSNFRPKISEVVLCLKLQVQLPSLPAKFPKPIYSTCPSTLSPSASRSSPNTRFTVSSTSASL